MTADARILLISGSTRGGSTNTATLRAAQEAAPVGVVTVLYEGLAQLPAFSPDDDQEPLNPAVADLRQQIAAADAVLICTPEYAGGLPGSFKNLLDWTVGGNEMGGKPVAWINVAAQGRGRNAHDSLAIVLSYVSGAPIESACRELPVARDAVSATGVVTDVNVRQQVADVLHTIRDHVSVTNVS